MATFDYNGTKIQVVGPEEMSVEEALDLESARGVGWDDLTDLAKVGALVGLSVVRAVPGTEWPGVLKSVSLAHVRAANEALQVEAAEQEARAQIGDGEVLSPTSAASEHEPPAA